MAAHSAVRIGSIERASSSHLLDTISGVPYDPLNGGNRRSVGMESIVNNRSLVIGLVLISLLTGSVYGAGGWTSGDR